MAQESQSELTLKQALDITAQVFAKTQGNLQDHQIMQAVLATLAKPLQIAEPVVPIEPAVG